MICMNDWLRFSVTCAIFATVVTSPAHAQFVPNEVAIGDQTASCLGLEFSPDMRWCVWTQQGTPNRAWLCGVDRASGNFIPVNGKPTLNGVPFAIADIPPSGNPQWGQDSAGWHIIAIADNGDLVRVRPGVLDAATGRWTLAPTIERFVIPAGASNTTRQYPFATRLPDRAGSYVAYEQIVGNVAGIYYVDLADPTLAERRVDAPTGYSMPPSLQDIAVTIYRWFPGLPVLTFAALQGPPQVPVRPLKMCQIDVSAPSPMSQAINPGNDTVSFHTDDFPSVNFGRRTLMGGLNATTSARHYLQDAVTNQTSTLADITVTRAISALSNPQWATSFEPFEWNGKLYSAFQIIDGQSPLAAVPAEIWLTSLSDFRNQSDTSLLRRLNTSVSRQRRDPEYFLGTSTAWVYWYARAQGAGPFAPLLIYRAHTGLPTRDDLNGDGRTDIDDLYEMIREVRDVTGDNVADSQDVRWLQEFLRRNEAKDVLTGLR
jgi:hypothetical protein